MTTTRVHHSVPLMEYTAPAVEWAALLLLATQPHPAQALASGEWQRTYFSSPGTAEAFAQLEAASTPILLHAPSALEGEIAALLPTAAATAASAAASAPATDAASEDAADADEPAQQPSAPMQPPPAAAMLEGLRRTLAGWAQTRALDEFAADLRYMLRQAEAQQQPVNAELLSVARTRLDTITALDTRSLLHGGSAQSASAQSGSDHFAATLAELAAGYWQRINEQRDAAPTGLAQLNAKLGGGLQPRRLVVLLGPPGSGKTTLANQIAEHVADSGRPVLYLTMEDPAHALLAKTVARIGRLDYGAVLQGRLAQQQQIDAALAAVMARISAPRLLYLEDSGRLTLEMLRLIARTHFARYPASQASPPQQQHASGGSGVIVVDYLQRWARAQRTAPGESRDLREVVSWLCEALREVARELDCTVIALASQNRGNNYRASGTDSALASAKESGDIEYTADVLLALNKDPERDSVAPGHEALTIYLPKNRQGETGKLDLDWYPARQTFTEVVP